MRTKSQGARIILKVNYIGIIAGIIAFASLFLSWFTIKLWTENLNSTMEFAANLFQLTGTVEGVTKTISLTVWFNVGALILMMISGLACLVGSTVVERRRTMILIVSCVLPLIAMAVFGFGLANSSLAVERINPGYTISQFPEGSFGLSAEQSMQRSYDYSWAIGIGFWFALIAAILALVAALVSRKTRQ
jgi:uncharacterized membrane protein